MLQFKRRQALSNGELAERLIALVLKTSRRESASGVRIPHSPPVKSYKCLIVLSRLGCSPTNFGGCAH